MPKNLRDLSAMLRAAGPKLKYNAAAAELKTAQAARDIAIKTYSSGPYSLNDLRKAGHPYATRNPQPSYPASVINGGRQFAEDWTIVDQAREGDTLKTSFSNTDPNTQYLFGTPKMVDRSGMLGAIEEQMQPVRDANLNEAIAKTFRELFQ